MTAKLIAIEGLDGSGKETQTNLLRAALEARGLSVGSVSFPRYGQPSAAPVEQYLSGGYGERAADVNAYAASALFAVDRLASFLGEWRDQYDECDYFIADRYTTANALFQVTKVAKIERKSYLDWLYDLEYNKMGLPRPDLVVYLDVPPEVSERMRTQREADTNTQADIHENLAMQQKVRESALYVAEHGTWKIVNCVDDKNHMRSIEEINADIMKLVQHTLETKRVCNTCQYFDYRVFTCVNEAGENRFESVAPLDQCPLWEVSPEHVENYV